MQIKPCRPYHSKTVGRELVRMPDGRSAFKVYFLGADYLAAWSPFDDGPIANPAKLAAFYS